MSTNQVSRTRPLLVTWDAADRHRGLTRFALAGLVVGAAMAVFGMPPFDSHGVLYQLGVMSPICGGTRSVYFAMRGDLASSWRYNPVGIPLVLGAVLLLARHVLGRATGRWLTVRFPARRLAIAVLAVLLVLLEVNQQLHASFLMHS